jgi:MFS family permease
MTTCTPLIAGRREWLSLAVLAVPTILVAGSLGDRIGRTRLLLIGGAAFAVASVRVRT